VSAAALHILLAGNPSAMTLDGTRTFVVGIQRPVVIDPGPRIREHLEAVEGVLGGVEPVAIVLTHGHPDHSAAAPELARRTGGPIWMAPGGLHPPFDPAHVSRWIRADDIVETDVGRLRCVATPGHAPEHLALHWTGGGASGRGAVFVGDLLMGVGDTALVAWPEGEVAAYLDSLDRVAELPASVLYPAHGPPLDDPPAALERYRRHRLERADQVRRSLGTRPATVPELRERVYGATVPPGLERAAEDSLRALLAYLVDLGEVATEHGRFRRVVSR
jgi:glyoxylase-like metal-dependent hydrolase (beta-lactamase superfamily II)